MQDNNKEFYGEFYQWSSRKFNDLLWCRLKMENYKMGQSRLQISLLDKLFSTQNHQVAISE